MLNHVPRLALASAFVALGAQSAWALDADDFGAKLKETVKLLGIAIDYAAATAEGDAVTLSDFTLHIPGEEDVDLPGDLVFSGVVETGDGGYTAQTASIADVEIEDLEDGFSVFLRNVAIEGITVPAAIDFADLLPAVMGLYERVSMGPLSFSKDGAEVFAIDSIAVTMGHDGTMSELTSDMLIEGIRGDLSTLPDEEARDVIAAFGLEQFNARLSGTSTWYPETGRAVLDDFAFAIDNLGTISANGAILGYTREFYQELMKINVKMADLAESDETISDIDMAGFEQAMLDKLMDVQIESLAVRYDDASLFMKVLDFVGAEQGVDGETFADGLKFMVPMMLVEVPDADFKAAVTREVKAFIDDPQNFEVSANPDTPVSVEDLAAAEEDPFALIELLNVTVRANQ